MNQTMVDRLQMGGVDIFGDNGEHIAKVGEGLLQEFVNATNARHFSHHFEPMGRSVVAQREPNAP